MATWRPVEPMWITPSCSELADVHVLAFRTFRDTGSAKAEAMGATAAWIRGGRTAPVTFREEQPVTKALAKAEMWAAVHVVTGDVPLESFCLDLGVHYAPAVATNPVWSLGVEEVLRWLTADPLERRKPPIPLPRRNPDGSVATAEELYQQTMATQPHKKWGPEERRALRNRTEVDAIRSERLAARIEETLRRSCETA